MSRRNEGRRNGARGGLLALVGQGIGMASEYREHRKEQKLARSASQQDNDQTTPGESSRDVQQQPPAGASDLPPAYTDIAGGKDRSLAAGLPASDEKKQEARSEYDDDSDFDTDSDDTESIENDEEDWELDEALTTTDSKELPTYEESEFMKEGETVEDLVRDVMAASQPLKTTTSRRPFVRQPIPCPVIIPQRRPRNKARGFVRAYAPVLESSGIDQQTFLKFLKAFHKSSQASPIFPALQIAAGIVGMAPEVIAMAVSTAVQIAAGIGAEVQARQRTNNFLDRMNKELFEPAGLYAMIVQYKSNAEMEQAASGRVGQLTNLIRAEKVDMSTNQTIAKYSRTLSESTGAASRSMSDRMKDLRLASGTTRGTIELAESAPLIFPDIDQRMAQEGPETFKDKTKDAKKFLADYLDRRAQMQYANQDPDSTLVVPETQRGLKSKFSDPKHPMYSGGLITLVSGGALTPRHAKRERRQEKALRRDMRRMDRGRAPRHERQRVRRYGEEYHDELYARTENRNARFGDYHGRDLSVYPSRSSGFEDPYDTRGGVGRSLDGQSGAAYGQGSSRDSQGRAAYAPYGRRRRQRRRGGGPLGMIRRVMREDVLYLMIVNMPSEAELAQAREELARAKGQA